MDALDTNCEQLGLIPLQLMENAGSAVSAEVMVLIFLKILHSSSFSLDLST
jgi:NAD(P)H-hydrate repair Nnr-like enzyme with NAD(P)H-hydrate epimerase domain